MAPAFLDWLDLSNGLDWLEIGCGTGALSAAILTRWKPTSLLAIDPITRANLQNEFVRILRTLGKTVIFVTHDIDAAVKMGDKIALLKDGRLVQFGSPDDILSQPVNAFVAEFVGADRALKRLNLITVRDAMRADVGTDLIGDSLRRVGPDIMLRDALSQMLSLGVQDLAVFDGDERLIGHISLSAIQDRLRPKS